MSNTPEAANALGPKELADQLFNASLQQMKGDYREAARQVIVFLKEALIYAVSASATEEGARKALLKSMGESISALGVGGSAGAEARHP